MTKINYQLTLSPKDLPDQNNLGFGNFYTDHMLIAKHVEGIGWSTPEIIPFQPLALDPGASVFHYGQSIFEGLKAFSLKDGGISLFRPEFNYNRFKQGADRVCLECPPLDLFIDGIKELVKIDRRWIPTQPGTSLYIRPTLIGVESFLGVRPSQETLFFVILSPVGSYFSDPDKGVKLKVEEKYLRAAEGGLGNIKAGANYVASLKPALEAKKQGFDQVLWLDTTKKFIEESGAMNVFFVYRDRVVTPALNGSILPGCTRDSIIKVLKWLGLQVIEDRVSIEDILRDIKNGQVVEAFGAGTAAVISPVGLLSFRGKDFVVGDGKAGNLGKWLYQRLTSIQKKESDDIFNWVTTL